MSENERLLVCLVLIFARFLSSVLILQNFPLLLLSLSPSLSSLSSFYRLWMVNFFTLSSYNILFVFFPIENSIQFIFTSYRFIFSVWWCLVNVEKWDKSTASSNFILCLWWLLLYQNSDTFSFTISICITRTHSLRIIQAVFLRLKSQSLVVVCGEIYFFSSVSGSISARHSYSHYTIDFFFFFETSL